MRQIQVYNYDTATFSVLTISEKTYQQIQREIEKSKHHRSFFRKVVDFLKSLPIVIAEIQNKIRNKNMKTSSNT